MSVNAEFETPPTVPARPRGKKRPLLLFVTGLLVVVAIGYGSYFLYQNQQFGSARPSDAQELAAVVAKVSRLMDVPTNETPVLATVTDKEKISSQTFFARAENGDKVLLYTSFGRAILYRPSTNRIVDVTLINTTQTTPAAPNSDAAASQPNPIPTTTEPTPTPQLVTVAIYNGTSTLGLASTAEKKLLEQFPDLQVTQKTNAALRTYPTTVVVDLTQQASDVAAQIATNYQTTVTTQVPDGEVTPSADVLIILGENGQ